jgi:hypothetical protein
MAENSNVIVSMDFYRRKAGASAASNRGHELTSELPSEITLP